MLFNELVNFCRNQLKGRVVGANLDLDNNQAPLMSRYLHYSSWARVRGSRTRQI